MSEEDRQLIIRGLAIQALWNPGFVWACREAAAQLEGIDMFDDFLALMQDIVPIQADHGFPIDVRGGGDTPPPLTGFGPARFLRPENQV